MTMLHYLQLTHTLLFQQELGIIAWTGEDGCGFVYQRRTVKTDMMKDDILYYMSFREPCESIVTRYSPGLRSLAQALTVENLRGKF
jgi:hypothetical protein